MSKAKTWETKTRIYKVDRKGNRYYTIKPNVNKKTSKKIGLLTAVGEPKEGKTYQGTTDVQDGVQSTAYALPPETPEQTIERLNKVVRELGHKTQDLPHRWPTTGEIDTLIYKVEERVKYALQETKKEGTRQDLDLVLHHLKIARRYFNKALTL